MIVKGKPGFICEFKIEEDFLNDFDEAEERIKFDIDAWVKFRKDNNLTVLIGETERVQGSSIYEDKKDNGEYYVVYSGNTDLPEKEVFSLMKELFAYVNRYNDWGYIGSITSFDD